MSRRFVPESTTLPDDIKDVLIEFGMYVRMVTCSECVCSCVVPVVEVK